MTYKNTLAGSVLIIVIMLAAWTTLSYHPKNNLSNTASDSPDSYMESFTATFMDRQGKIALKIEAPKMVHFAGNDKSELTNPQLTLYRKSTQPWYIASKYAKSTNGLSHIDFWDDVTIHHAADLSSPATLIKTPKLTVHPNDQTAETSELITLIQPNIIVKAIGMMANMETGNIKLLSQAQGEYAPNS